MLDGETNPGLFSNCTAKNVFMGNAKPAYEQAEKAVLEFGKSITGENITSDN